MQEPQRLAKSQQQAEFVRLAGFPAEFLRLAGFPPKPALVQSSLAILPAREPPQLASSPAGQALAQRLARFPPERALAQSSMAIPPAQEPHRLAKSQQQAEFVRLAGFPAEFLRLAGFPPKPALVQSSLAILPAREPPQLASSPAEPALGQRLPILTAPGSSI